MINVKKYAKKIIVGAAALSIATTSMQAFAATDWKVFSFYLYPGESTVASSTSTKGDTRGYAQVKTQSMTGGGSHKIVYSIYSGSSQLSERKTVTGTGTVNVSYNSTPDENTVCKLKGSVPSTQNAPLRAEGDWIS